MIFNGDKFNGDRKMIFNEYRTMVLTITGSASEYYTARLTEAMMTVSIAYGETAQAALDNIMYDFSYGQVLTFDDGTLMSKDGLKINRKKSWMSDDDNDNDNDNDDNDEG